MLNKDDMVSITNRDSGIVSYVLQDASGKSYIKRKFQTGETKEVPFGELKELSYQNGGMYMLKHLLRIDNQDVVNELLGSVEPEYNYSAEDIKELLLNGTIDELKDCLDFAPDGVKELIKSMAIDLRIDSTQKRRAISEALNFDITRAIEIEEEVATELGENKNANTGFKKIEPTRRTQSENIHGKAEPVRRTNPPQTGKYVRLS